MKNHVVEVEIDIRVVERCVKNHVVELRVPIECGVCNGAKKEYAAKVGSVEIDIRRYAYSLSSG